MRVRTWIVGAMGLLVAACSGQPPDPDDARATRAALGSPLVGEWKLEDNALDTSGFGNDGTINGGATFTDGHIRRALSLDGVDDSLTLGNGAVTQFDLSEAFSTSLWVSTTPNLANHSLLGNSWSGPGWHVRINASNMVRFILVENGTTYRYVDSTIALGSGYHHVATTWDGSSAQHIYIDGVDVTGAAQTRGTLTSITTTAPITVGTLTGVSAQLGGQVDQIRLYAVALTGSEVQTLFAETGNTAPVAVAGSANTNKNTPVTITLQGTDADSDALTFAVATGPTNGTLGTITPLTPTSASVTYTPGTDYVGGDSFTFTVNDGTVTSTPATVTLTVSNTLPTLGLVAELKLEDNFVDTSGSNNHGFGVGFDPTFVDAKVGRGAHFDGVDDTIGLGSGSSLQFGLGSSFSTSEWVNATVNSQNHAILGTSWSGPGWHVRITSGNRVRFILVQNATTFRFVDSTTTLSAGWHHIVTSWDGSSNQRIWIDGVDVTGSVGTSGTLTNIDNPTFITVGSVAGASVPYAGDIDQIRIYDRVLDGTDVAALFGEGAGNSPPVANAGSTSTPQDAPVTITLTGSDVDNDPLTFAIATPPAHGTLGAITPVNATTATVQYTPTTSYVGADAFTFTVNDGAATSSAATVSIAVTSTASTLVAEYLFENNTLDTSGNGNDGTPSGSFGYTAGYLGSGASFINSDSSVGLGSGSSIAFDLADAFSVSTWINTTPDNQNHAIIGNAWSGPGWHVRITTANKLRFILVQNAQTFRYVDSSITLGSGWHHVATTYDGSSAMKIYLDGVDVTSAVGSSGTLTSITTSSPLTVGSVSGASIPYNGDLDQLRLYNAALTPSEVATLFGETIVNQTPTATAGSDATPINQAKQLTLTGSDPENATLTFQIATPPQHGTLGTISQTGATTAQVTYTPNTDYVGPDSFTFTVSDGNSTSTAATFTLSVDPVIPRDTLVGEYFFEDNVNDTSGAGNTGTVVGNAAFVDGLFARSLRFDGVDDAVDLGAAPSLKFGLASSFSTSTWLSASGSGTNRAILGNSWAGPGWHVRVTTTNRVRFILVQSANTYRYVDSTTTLPAGYHHIVTTYDGSTMKIFIDGADVTSTVGTSGTLSNIDAPTNVTIGSVAGASIPLAGDVDNVRIYGRVLTSADIASLFNE